MPYSVPRVYLPRPDYLYQSWRFRQQHLRTDSAQVKNLLAEYDLDLTEKPVALSGGNRSHSLLARTSGGSKILKKYKRSLGLPTITQEHAILTYLAQVNFPSPRLVATKGKQTLMQRGEDRYALFDFIEGGFQYHHYLLLPAQVRQFITIAGEVLADLHKKLEGFIPQGYNPDGFKSNHEDRRRNLEWVLNKLAHCVNETTHLNAGASKSQLSWFLSQANYLEDSLIHLESLLESAPLPRLVIHADFGPYNLLFRRSEPAIVLDFEMARLDWRMTELIGAWYRFSHNKIGFRPHKMKWLLDAYHAHFPLTEDEWRLMPMVWKLLNIRRSIVNWYRYCETQNDTHLTKARWHLQVVDWFVANQDDLMTQLNPANCRLSKERPLY